MEIKLSVSEELAYKCLLDEWKIASNRKSFVIVCDDWFFNDEDDWLEI